MSDEPEIAALREEIRRAGRAYGWFWVVVFGWIALDPLLLVLLFFVHRHGSVPGWYVALFSSWIAGFCVLAVATFRFLLRARGRIRALWDPLTSGERAEALEPLAQNMRRAGPTKEIMLPFLRGVGASAELAPAPAPHARGDEPTPAEDPHGTRWDG